MGDGKWELADGFMEGQGQPPVGVLMADSMQRAGNCPCPQVRRRASVYVVAVEGTTLEPVRLQYIEVQLVDTTVQIDVTGEGFKSRQ
jgi:hypothetical protein